jgi:hypothetical protein
MGTVRAAWIAFAIVVACAATATSGAGPRRPRGVHVKSVVRLSDEAAPYFEFPAGIHFDLDGNLVDLGYGVWRRITANQTTLSVAAPELVPVRNASWITAWDSDGSVYSLDPVAAEVRLVRVTPDGAVTSTPIYPDGMAYAMTVRSGQVQLLTERDRPSTQLWLQRFMLDGTPDGPAVRVTPPDGPTPSQGWASLDVDSAGSAYVLWRSSKDPTLSNPYESDVALNWRRIDTDGSVSPPTRVVGDPDFDPSSYWSRRLGPDGSMWIDVFPHRGVIGIRRDGSPAPTVDQYAERNDGRCLDGRVPHDVETFGVDGAGEVRTLRSPYCLGPYFAQKWRPIWRRFSADGTLVRSRRLHEQPQPRRGIGPSGFANWKMEVASDGSSLVVLVRNENGVPSPRGVIEFLHVDAGGRVLSRGSFTPAFALGQDLELASTVVAGLPRFAIAWTASASADGPLLSFAAILE